MRGHQRAVAREQAGGQIVVSCIERSCKILRKVAELRLYIPKRTRVRRGTRIRPVHLLPPGEGTRQTHHGHQVSQPVRLAHSSASLACGKRKVFLSTIRRMDSRIEL